ncbi:MAG: hypothetical protein WEA28_05315, partial [Xanthobacteraceae bacterium]
MAGNLAFTAAGAKAMIEQENDAPSRSQETRRATEFVRRIIEGAVPMKSIVRFVALCAALVVSGA